MAQFMTIVRFDEIPPAERLATRLREAGYDARIQDESDAQVWQLYNIHPRAHILVNVPQDDADRAMAHIRDWDVADRVLDGAARCPECGSTRVQFPQFSRRTIMGAFPAVLASAGVIEKDFYCEACQATWPPAQPPPEPERDILNWPKGTATL